VLVLNGAADKSAGNEDIVAFGKEMDAAGADWQFVNFRGAVRGRTPQCVRSTA
jgi:hypothetical protein